MEEIYCQSGQEAPAQAGPQRPQGTFGKSAIWGVRWATPARPVYAGEAVPHGSGLVFVSVPGEVYPIAAARCDTRHVSPAPRRYEDLRSWMSRCDAALIGPGWAVRLITERKVRGLLEDADRAVVLDADGINAGGHAYR